MNNTKAKQLLKRYNEGTCTPEEKDLVEIWFLEATENIEDHLPDPDYNTVKSQLWDKITAARQKPVIKTLWSRIAAAASVILLLSAASYYVLRQPATHQQTAANQTKDIGPGGNKAILTLANGQQIVLADTKTGQFATQPGAAVIKTNGSEVIYKNAGANVVNMAYNTITTPRGGNYHLTLADGTGVWLNSASSITFPVSFNGPDRSVMITGEAYFEVVHDSAHPFNVKVKGQIIQDLGTHFNINAYDDEQSLKATLLEGKIKVNNQANFVILHPGQQAEIKYNSLGINVANDANPGEAIAWHNGLFEFHDASIQTVMRQLARWYDVEVIYEGKPTDRLFSGKIYKNITALKVSDILSYSNIHFRIEGRKIIVMP